MIVRERLLTSSSGEARTVCVFVPDVHAAALANSRIVYMTDGQMLPAFIQHCDLHRIASLSCPLVLVGIESLPGTRASELLGKPDATRGAGFRDFFMHALPHWLGERFGIHHQRDRTGVLGISLGGAFALRTGLQFPRFASFVAAFSVAGWRTPEILAEGWLDRIEPELPVRYYFSAGSREKPVLNNLQRLHRELTARGVPVQLTDHPLGHEFELWRRELPAAMAWWLSQAELSS